MTTPWISSIVPTLFPSPLASLTACLASSRASCASSTASAARWPLSVSWVACSTWSPPLAEPLGTRDDFHDLLCDVRLALPVGLEGEVVDQLGGVLGRVAHR